MSSKRKGDEHDSTTSAVSKKRATRGDKAKTVNLLTSLRIRLSEKTRESAGLISPEIINIPDLSYLSNIASECWYLYDPVRRICDIADETIQLYLQTDGQQRDDNDSGWKGVSKHDSIVGGCYLCVVPEGITSMTR